MNEMIADLDRTLHNLLTLEVPDVQNGQAEVAFNQPTGEWSKQLAKPTLNLFLYDLRDNPVLRQHQWQPGTNGSAPRVNQDQHSLRFKRSPLRIDCFYLVTAWGTADPREKSFQEHSLLTQSMLALARYPILNLPPDEQLMQGRRLALTGVTPPFPKLLVGGLDQQKHEIRTRLAAHDVMTNPAELWSSLDNQIRAGFSYVVNLPLDPWIGWEQAADEVTVATIRTGQKA